MLKEILELDGVSSLSKKMQQKISGSGRPFICEVICPSYCHCASPPYNDYCIFSSGPKQGQYCAAL